MSADAGRHEEDGRARRRHDDRAAARRHGARGTARPGMPGGCRSRTLAVTLLAALLAAGCSSAIPVRPVEYRMPPSVHFPLAAAGVTDASAEFADLFCSVLEHVDDLADVWNPCGDYLHAPGRPGDEPGPLPDGYRVLVISGILSQCISEEEDAELTSFHFARRHLEQEHGFPTEYLEVPAYGSSAFNGRRIADYIKEQRATDPRPYLVVAFSKGTPDTLEGIVADDEARQGVAGLVTVAGAIGGSRAVDPLEEQVGEIIGRLSASDCEVGDNGGFESLRRENRMRFMAEQEWPVVPTWSVVGIVTEDEASAVNRITWRYLSHFSLEQDGQMIAADAVVPGGTWLGAVHADHWALTMPFDRKNDRLLNEIIDRNRFPREALFEALVRFALADLESR